MDTVLEEIANHLEYFGYTIEKEEPENDTDRLTYHARHERRFNLRYFEMNKNFVLFQICFSTDIQPTPELSETINEFNRIGLLAKYYYTTNTEGFVLIYIEAMYIGDYAKTRFGLFYDMFETDHRKARESDAYKKCFITKQEPTYMVQ
jgi:hypothetical protein